jgi:hypothetical protein
MLQPEIALLAAHVPSEKFVFRVLASVLVTNQKLRLSVQTTRMVAVIRADALRLVFRLVATVLVQFLRASRLDI